MQQDPPQVITRTSNNTGKMVAIKISRNNDDDDDSRKSATAATEANFNSSNKNFKAVTSSKKPTKKKTKKKGKASSHNGQPRRPLSAYNFFFQIVRDRLVSGNDSMEFTEEQVNKTRSYSGPRHPSHKRTHGRIGFQELAHTIGRNWKSLEPRYKELFSKRAKEDRRRYDEEMKVWKESFQRVDIPSRTATTAPSSAFSPSASSCGQASFSMDAVRMVEESNLLPIKIDSLFKREEQEQDRTLEESAAHSQSGSPKSGSLFSLLSEHCGLQEEAEDSHPPICQAILRNVMVRHQPRPAPIDPFQRMANNMPSLPATGSPAPNPPLSVPPCSVLESRRTGTKYPMLATSSTSPNCFARQFDESSLSRAIHQNARAGSWQGSFFVTTATEHYVRSRNGSNSFGRVGTVPSGQPGITSQGLNFFDTSMTIASNDGKEFPSNIISSDDKMWALFHPCTEDNGTSEGIEDCDDTLSIFGDNELQFLDQGCDFVFSDGSDRNVASSRISLSF